MSTAFSQDFVQADRLIRRRYVQIPGKQKDLLERPDAWSENLSHGTRGMINVPPEVLQDIKDFHLRRHSKPTQEPYIFRPASPAAPGPPPRSARTKQPLSIPRLGRDEQDGDDEATVLSWSPSPSRPPPGRHPQTIEQPELVSSPTSQSPSHPTSLKRKTPPPPSAVCPPSSGAKSDALPYEPPAILGPESLPLVNRGANQVTATHATMPVPTPPSAQAEVAPIYLSKPASKRRRVEEMGLSDREDETMEQIRPPPGSTLKPRSAAPHNGRSLSSASISTPSFPSQTAVEKPQHCSLPQTASVTDSNERSSYRFTPTYEGRPRGTPSQQNDILRHSASRSSMAPAPAQPWVYSAHPTLVKESQSHASNNIGHRTPYEEFKAAYPDYEESTRAFIRACLAVEKLECERALPEFLYDDFVRVHSTVYMDYYEQAQDREYSEVLKATHWYNENVKDMVYAKKIIRRDNLRAILKAHSTAVQQIRESIQAPIEASPPNEDASSNDESDERIGDDIRQAHGEQRATKGFEPQGTSGARLSPELHIASPGPVATVGPTTFETDDLEEADEPPGSVPAPPTRHQTGELEYRLGESLQNDKTAAEHTHKSRASPELNFQEPGTVLDEEAPVEEGSQAVERPTIGRKSPNPRRSLPKTPTPATFTPKTRSGKRKLLAPLSSSPPSSAQRAANDKTMSCPPQQTARQSSPGFRSQPKSSDDESDSFDPPVATAAMPRWGSAERDESVFLTQAQSAYEIPGTPNRLREESMPPAAPPSEARTPTGHKSHSVPGPASSVATTATALTPHAATQKQGIARGEGLGSRSPTGSSIGGRKGPASSARAGASVPLFKRREGETKEERSKRFKEHLRKRMSGKTPGSTPASTR